MKGGFHGSWEGSGTAVSRRAAATPLSIVPAEHSNNHGNEISAAEMATAIDTEEAQSTRQVTITLHTHAREATSTFCGTNLVKPAHLTPLSMPVIFQLSVRLQPGMLVCVVDVQYSVTLDQVMHRVRERLDADEEIWPSVVGIGWSRQIASDDFDAGGDEEEGEMWDEKMWGRIKRLMMGATGGTVEAEVVWRRKFH